MAGSVNKVILVGNLGKDPEVRTTQDGNKIVNLTLATSETWNDRASGERKEKTEWHRVVIFNDRVADVAERFLKKGREDLCGGVAADAQVDRPIRAGALYHRGGDRPLQRAATMLDGRSGGGESRRLQRTGGSEHGWPDMRRGSVRPAIAGCHGRALVAGEAGTPSWDAPKGGDLDDEIPF